MNFFKNLCREVDNNPAMMILVWLLFTVLFAVNYIGLISLAIIIANLVLLLSEIKKYRRKY